MKAYDGDQEYRQLHEKIQNKEPLAEEEILKLIFLPLMKSNSFTEDQMAIQAAELAKNIEGEKKTFVIGALVAVTDRFMSEKYKKRLLEVLKMTQIEQWIREEGMKEGLKEGVKEGKKEGLKEGEIKKALETARAALKKGLPEDLVTEITGLDLETVRKLKGDLN